MNSRIKGLSVKSMERVKWTSDEKVIIVRSWHSRARSLLSLARRAQSKEVNSSTHSSCRRAHETHAEELMQESSFRKAHASHAEELMQLMQKSSCSSCRRAHVAHVEELMQLMQKSSCRRANAAHAEELM